ncbi:hypothetical protein NPIL_367461 [Nephila pilipes]|uniref:Uncharacterized protein n=1 Tax=Nephila pilipes TaxID=299642 RepID=A0A8X6U1I7_NEPPI|nr:hypothetical protein NPIL_367461 [Nephila pilipes]
MLALKSVCKILPKRQRRCCVCTSKGTKPCATAAAMEVLALLLKNGRQRWCSSPTIAIPFWKHRFLFDHQCNAIIRRCQYLRGIDAGYARRYSIAAGGARCDGSEGARQRQQCASMERALSGGGFTGGGKGSEGQPIWKRFLYAASARKRAVRVQL